jgi:hypothetical protein
MKMKMKLKLTGLFILMLLLITNYACKNNTQPENLNTDLIDPENPPVITFKDSVYSFGDIAQGQIVKYSFEFTNTGKSDLLIQSVRGSCGCTVPKNWPDKPIKPGDGGKIEVHFDSEGKKGFQRVYITILANTKPTKTEVFMKGNVIVPNE